MGLLQRRPAEIGYAQPDEEDQPDDPVEEDDGDDEGAEENSKEEEREGAIEEDIVGVDGETLFTRVHDEPKNVLAWIRLMLFHSHHKNIAGVRDAAKEALAAIPMGYLSEKQDIRLTLQLENKFGTT